jgi:Glycosyltransferase family 87
LADSSTLEAPPPRSNGNRTGPATPPRRGSVLLLVGLVGALFWLVHRGDWWGWWLEDLPVYSRALLTWLAGQNPYNDSMSPLYFLYPPVFLYLAKLVLIVLPRHWGEEVYFVTHVVAVIGLPLVLARYYFRQAWLGPLFALVLFFASPRFTGVLALCGVNVASILYCLAFVAAIPGLRRNRWEWFYLAVFLASIIKITFLVLLLLPLLAGRRQWVRSIVCGLAVIGVNVGEWVWLPVLYKGYEWSLKQGILVQQQFGYGIFGILATYHHRTGTPVGLHAYIGSVVLALGMLLLMFALRRRLERVQGVPELATNGIWLALVVVMIIVANPREMQYDVDIALFAAFVLWVYALRTKRVLILMLALFLPSLAVPYVVLNPHMHGIYETLVVLVGFGLGFWRLWRESGKRLLVAAAS